MPFAAVNFKRRSLRRVIKSVPIVSCLQREVGGGDGEVASRTAVVTTPAKRRPRKRKAKKKAVARQASASNGESSSDEDLSVEREVNTEPGSEESSWISELPGLVSSDETEDENDPVYSLRPLFTGQLNWLLRRVVGFSLGRDAYRISFLLLKVPLGHPLEGSRKRMEKKRNGQTTLLRYKWTI